MKRNVTLCLTLGFALLAASASASTIDVYVRSGTSVELQDVSLELKGLLRVSVSTLTPGGTTERQRAYTNEESVEIQCSWRTQSEEAAVTVVRTIVLPPEAEATLRVEVGIDQGCDFEVEGATLTPRGEE